jgi:hypothetical protein
MSGPMDNEIVDLGAVWAAREMERSFPVPCSRGEPSGCCNRVLLRRTRSGNSTASLRASRRSLLGTG